ncbi:HTH_Tnp_Tc3_2 domain-containing protein [Trichonephila clavipes]|nr:HTH_Tnp_Tc3_2 domain-containing protein [Trichonephila clavipes]
MPQTLDHLEDNIRRVIADIRAQMLEKVIENWTSRLDYIRASRGSPMPEIIFKMSVANAVSMIRGPQATGTPTCVTTVPLTWLSFLKKGTEGVLIRGPLRTRYARDSFYIFELATRIRAHYKQLSEFDRDRIITLKKDGCVNRRIASHMGRRDASIIRFWQEWVESGRCQRHDGSGRPKATADR